MATVSKCAIYRYFAGRRLENCKNLVDHDGSMRTGRSLATSEDFLDVGGVALGLVLFVLLIEATRVLAVIALASWRFASR